MDVDLIVLVNVELFKSLRFVVNLFTIKLKSDRLRVVDTHPHSINLFQSLKALRLQFLISSHVRIVFFSHKGKGRHEPF